MKISAFSLDSRAILSMVFITIGALIVVGFRYATQVPCSPGEIMVTGSNNTSHPANYHTGEPIAFNCTPKKGEQYVWAFGDESLQKANGPSVVHSYLKPGKYTVSLTVNGSCATTYDIEILQAPVARNPLLIPRFICPINGEVGKPLQFTDSTVQATSWEWHFGESGQLDAINQSPTYTYTTPGFKTVILIINGKSDFSATCKVYIAPKSSGSTNSEKTKLDIPPTMLPEFKEMPESLPLPQEKSREEAREDAPSVGASQIEQMIREVVQGQKGLEVFGPYVCDNLNIPVTYNDENMTLQGMISKLKEAKYKRIKEITPVRIDKGDHNCITSLVIKAKIKTGIF